MLVVVGALMIIGTSAAAFRHAGASFDYRHPNIYDFVFVYLLVTQCIGAVLLASGTIHSNWWLLRARDAESAILDSSIALGLVMLGLPVTIGLFNILLGVDRVRIRRSMYGDEPGYVGSGTDQTAFIWLGLLVGLGAASVGLLLFRLGRVPLFALLGGADAATVAALRVDAVSLGFLSSVAINIIGHWLTPVFCLVAYGYWMLSGRWRYAVLFIVSFSVAVVALTFTTEKAPILYFFMMLALLGAMDRGEVRSRLVVGGIALFVASVVGLYVWVMGFDQIEAAAGAAASRIIVNWHAGHILAFDYYPAVEGFIGSMTFIPLGSLVFDEDTVRSYALRMMEYYNPGSWREGSVAYLSTLFTAEAYAGWGWPGVIGGIGIVGGFLSVIGWMIAHVRKHPVSMALVAFLSIRVLGLIGSGFRFAFYSPELLVTLFVLVVLVFAIRGRFALVKVDR